MDRHIQEYFHQFSDEAPQGNFHAVIPLYDSPHLTWSSLSKMVPVLPKGWFELAKLKKEDRIEFTQEYWLSQLPYHPKLQAFLADFFKSVDDIGIFVTQEKFDSPYEAHMVYSLAEDSGFFHGYAPTKENEILDLENLFPEVILPHDYLSFLKIHNGFCKYMDTGITRAFRMGENFKEFQSIIKEQDVVEGPSGRVVNPSTLIPFYKSFGLPCYQCFWTDWYPEEEMGNIYYSGLTKTMSNCQEAGTWSEKLAFPTFLDWLMFYLEKIG